MNCQREWEVVSSPTPLNHKNKQVPNYVIYGFNANHVIKLFKLSDRDGIVQKIYLTASLAYLVKRSWTGTEAH